MWIERRACFRTDLISDYQALAIGRPDKSKCLAEPLDLVDARLGPDVPELDDAVVADGAELGILDRVEGNPLNGCRVAFKLRGEADVVLLWVP